MRNAKPPQFRPAFAVDRKAAQRARIAAWKKRDPLGGQSPEVIKERAAFYTSTAWRTVRAAVLARDPICTICKAAPSRIADHIENRRARPDRALDPTNLRGCCASCHSRRTARDEGGLGNRKRSQP